MGIRIDLHYREWYDYNMNKRVKKIYKCASCETMITIITRVHELPESIICPCDNVAENQGSK
jgi:hypothetical protein